MKGKETPCDTGGARAWIRVLYDALIVVFSSKDSVAALRFVPIKLSINNVDVSFIVDFFMEILSPSVLKLFCFLLEIGAATKI